MTVYISLLRGINVSGHKPVGMEAFKRLYESLGLGHVVTYLRSGNVVFTQSGTKPDILAGNLRRRIEEDFGFDVPVIVFTADQFRRIVENNPMAKDSGKNEVFLHVTFLSAALFRPLPEYLEGMKGMEEKKQEGEEIVLSKEAAYLYCPKGYGQTKLTNNWLESKLGVESTTRNWKTVNALLDIADHKLDKATADF